jgi:hypothetical protein
VRIVLQIQSHRPLLDPAQQQMFSASQEIAPSRSASSIASDTSASGAGMSVRDMQRVRA